MPSRLAAFGDRHHARLLIGLGLFGLVALFALGVLVRVPLIYDEAPYLKPIALLHQYGLSIDFLTVYPEPAGLLHNIIHWLLEPITGLQPPLVRLVNPTMLVLVIILTALTLRTVGSPEPVAAGLSAMGIPFMWVVAGMALTELPAILLTALSIYLLVIASRHGPERLLFALVAALLGGASLGMAFLSRAMVLTILGALPCLLVRDWQRSWPVVAAYALGTMAVVGPVLVIWGGLVPPQSVVPVAVISFSIYHLVLSVAYASVVMLILAPRWFVLDWRLGGGIFGVIFVSNVLTGFVEISVARSVISQLPVPLTALVPSGLNLLK